MTTFEDLDDYTYNKDDYTDNNFRFADFLYAEKCAHSKGVCQWGTKKSVPEISPKLDFEVVQMVLPDGREAGGFTVSTPREKVYLAGPMRGVPEFNYPAFTEAAAALRKRGFEVFNPAEAFDGDTTRPARDYLTLDIEWIVTNKPQIVVLPGWEGSAGVRTEITVARALDLDIWTYSEFEGGESAIGTEQLPVDMEAAALVYGDRQAAYGHPREDFTRTGRMWAAILGVEEVTPAQVALMMVALKISRQVNRSKKDNVTDMIGYALTLARVEDMQA